MKKKMYLPLVAAMTAFFVVATGAVAFADNVENNAQAAGNSTITAGGSTTIRYWIKATNQDGQPTTGSPVCNAADGSNATLSITTPSGVAANPTSLTFTLCGGVESNYQEVTFSSSTPGSYQIGASITDAGAGTYSVAGASFTLTVEAASCTGPTVGTQPSSQSITYGNDGTFSAAASGSPAPTVQWQELTTAGGAVWTNISGATSGSLAVNDPTVAMSGYQYLAVFTSTCGTATSNAATLTVAKADQTISFGALGGKTYGDANFSVSATASSGLTVTFAASGDCTVSGTTVQIDGAGSCTITASQAGDSNWNAAPDVQQSFDIAKAPSVVALTCPTSVEYTGSARTPCTAKATGVGMDDVDLTSSIEYLNNINAGTASVSVSWDGDANHDGNDDTTTFEITKAPSVVALTCPTSVDYSGSEQTPCTAKATGVGMDDVDLTSSIEYSNNINAGTASVSVSWDGDANHDGNDDTTTFEINKVDADCSSIQGWSGTYDGSAHAATGTCEGVGSDGTLSGLTFSPSAGYKNYPGGTVSWTFEDETGNYNDDSGSVEITIAKADPGCSVTGYSVTYNGSSHTATGSCAGVNNEGPLSGLDLSGTTHTNAGSWTDSWTFTDSTGNYEDDSGTVSDSIAKASLTVTADNKTKYLGDPDPVFTFTYGSFQGSDTAAVIDSAPTCGVSVPHTTVGEYRIVCSGGSDNNYEFSYVDGTLTITYNWTGFFRPIDNPGTGAVPVFNVVKAGSAIPAKFSLSGFQGYDIFATGYPKMVPVKCDASAELDPIEVTVTAGSSSLNYDATIDQYNYVWKTQKSWAGTCGRLDVKLNDNTMHVAFFKFTK